MVALSDEERARLCARAEASWPELAVPMGRLEEHLQGLAGAEISDEGLREIVLACAISSGDDRALALFEQHYLSAIPPALAHMALDRAAIDDIGQTVREKLVVGDGSRCKLEQYAGKGTLAGLVRVVAVRCALTWIRKHRRELGAATDELQQLPEAGADPELAFVKERYRREFKAAFGAAVETLSDRERNLLRLHLLGGVTLEALADMYSVHRATVTRWLAKARQRVLVETRKAVERSLELPPSEFEAIMELISSRLDLSVSRVLRARDSATQQSGT